MDEDRDARGRAGDHRVPLTEPASVATGRAKSRRFSWRRLAAGGIGLAVVVGTFVFVLPRVADYGDVWAVVKELSWPKIAVLIGVTLLNLATYAPPWQAA